MKRCLNWWDLIWSGLALALLSALKSSSSLVKKLTTILDPALSFSMLPPGYPPCSPFSWIAATFSFFAKVLFFFPGGGGGRGLKHYSEALLLPPCSPFSAQHNKGMPVGEGKGGVTMRRAWTELQIKSIKSSQFHVYLDGIQFWLLSLNSDSQELWLLSTKHHMIRIPIMITFLTSKFFDTEHGLKELPGSPGCD